MSEPIAWKQLTDSEMRSRIDAALEQQLESLLIKLKDVIVIGVPYRVFDAHLACFHCGCMLSVYVDEKPHCLKCDDVKWWSQDVKDRVNEIMRGYPEQEKKERKEDISDNVIEYGKRLKEARVAKGLSIRVFASMITNDRGGKLTHSSVVNFETGRLAPSEGVKQQLEQLLGLGDDK